VSSLMPLLRASCTIMPCAPEVSINPGETMLTRTPFGPTSFAKTPIVGIEGSFRRSISKRRIIERQTVLDGRDVKNDT
jgi:hypothetical protein